MLLFFFTIAESFSGSCCLIIFDESNGVCVCVCVWVGGWSGGCVRVEERKAKRACFVVGSSFDYCFVSSLFMKLL